MELRPLDGNEDVNIITSQGKSCTSQYITVGFPTTLILVPLTSDVQVKYIVISCIVNIFSNSPFNLLSCQPNNKVTACDT